MEGGANGGRGDLDVFRYDAGGDVQRGGEVLDEQPRGVGHGQPWPAQSHHQVPPQPDVLVQGVTATPLAPEERRRRSRPRPGGPIAHAGRRSGRHPAAGRRRRPSPRRLDDGVPLREHERVPLVSLSLLLGLVLPPEVLDVSFARGIGRKVVQAPPATDFRPDWTAVGNALADGHPRNRPSRRRGE